MSLGLIGLDPRHPLRVLKEYFLPSARPVYAYGAVAIAVIALGHFCIGTILLLTDRANGCIIADAILTAFDHKRWLAGIALLLASITAIYGLLTKTFTGMSRLWLLSPQQAILTITLIGVANAIINQHYADHVYRDWQHIFVDQLGWIALFYIHGSGIIRRARDVQ
jgi:hypothetical protein